jgi:hypothetical protein
MNLPRELMQVICFWHVNSISESIGDYITDGMINRIEITDMFSDDMFSSVISSVILFPMDPMFKYQQNFSSMICNFLVLHISVFLIY